MKSRILPDKRLFLRSDLADKSDVSSL